MNITLTKLKALLQTYSDYDLSSLSDPEINSLKETIDETAQMLIWDIANGYDNGKYPDIIPEMQKLLSFFADSLTGFDRDRDYAHEIPGLKQFMLEKICDLLDHLQSYYPGFFDYDAELPAHYAEVRRKAREPGITQLIIDLRKTNAEPGLIDLLENYLESTDITERFRIRNWRQFFFQHQLQQLISELLRSSIDNYTLEILKCLISMDFNSIQVYGYFVKYVERITLGDFSAPEQLEQLIYLMKTFQQVRTDAKGPYDDTAPALKVSVIEGISAEITYIEQKERIYVNNFRAAEPQAPTKFYFKVAITLAELMFFFRIALEVKVIFTKFNSFLYEFVANHIKTERAENFSKKSIHNNFHNKPFPDKTVRVVRNWLSRMIEHIDLYYKF